MKSKRILIGLSVAALIAAGLGFEFQRPQGQAKQKPSQPQTQQAIPEFEVYRQMFHHHVTMKQKAEELEKQGKDGKFLREFYQRQANLNDDQARAFDEIASSCEKEIAQQDAKAKAIIDAALAKNGNGKLSKGSRPPDPPGELRSLWDERNAIIMRHRYGLEAAFGGSEFKRLDDYIKKDVVPHITTEPPNHPRPLPMGPKHGSRATTSPSRKPEGR